MAVAQTSAPVQRLTEAEAIKSLHVEADKVSATDEFSGALLVAKHGKEIFQQAYGLVDREQKIANILDTQFRFGSLGKMFTAVATLQLVQAGKLKLDDTVDKYLPDYPN